MENKKYYLIFLTGIVGLVGGVTLAESVNNITPLARKDEILQQGFIPPSKLQVKLEDEDKNGKLETILQIDGKKYMLRDVLGIPTLSAYEVKPAEIQYK